MRLIDADELSELYANPAEGELKLDNFHVPVAVIRANIRDMPTVDAIPVRHAYVIKSPVLDRFNYCVCSNCHTNISPQWKVCPACSTLDCVTLMNGEPKDEDVPDI